jgi:hypothetical protein
LATNPYDILPLQNIFGCGCRRIYYEFLSASPSK